jgi:hypothetical protein
MEFFRCPNTRKILLLPRGDDKVICSCGKPNPNVPTEHPGLHQVKTGLDHSVVLLESATLAEAVKEGFAL